MLAGEVGDDLYGTLIAFYSVTSDGRRRSQLRKRHGTPYAGADPIQGDEQAFCTDKGYDGCNWYRSRIR